MAEQEKVEKGQAAEPPLPANKGAVAKMLPLLVVCGTVVVFASAGFLVGRLFGTRGPAQTASANEPPAAEPPLKDLDPVKDKDEGWFYELEPVIANLDEPGSTRYIRITLILEITKAWDQAEATPILDQKKPLMKHWLTLYLANQTTENMRGERSLVRMQSEISTIFNQGLFPNAQTRVKDVLFKECAIQ